MGATICVMLLVGAASLLLLTRPPGQPFALQGDNLTLTHPLLADAHRQVAQGRLPLWTVGRWGGSPLIGDPVVGALYPPYHASYALAASPHRRALDVAVCLHLALLAGGMLWFLRGLGARPWAAAGATTLLLFAPAMAFMARHWIQYWAALAWWPLLFGATARLASSPGVVPGCIAPLALAAQVYAGYPQFALYSGATALPWVLAARGGRGRRVLLAAIVGAGGVGLAATQILAALPIVPESLRGGAQLPGLPVLLERMALSWRGWLEVASATPMAALTPYRLAPAALILAALGATRRDLASRYLLAVGLLAAMLATASSPLFAALHAIPPFDRFAGPGKLFYLFAFAVCALAALGLDRVADLSPAPRRAILAVLLSSLLPSAAGAWAALRPGYGAILLGAAVASAVLATLLAGRRSGPATAAPEAALVALAAGVFLVAADPFTPRQLSPEGVFGPLLERPIGEQRDGHPIGRLLALDESPRRRPGEPPQDGAVLRQAPLNFGALWGRDALDGIGPLVQWRWIDVMAWLAPGHAGAIVEQLGVETVVVPRGTALEAELLDAGFSGPPAARRGALLRWLRAPRSRPRFELLAEARAATREEARAAARRGAALGDGWVLVEGLSGDGAPAAPATPGAARSIAAGERPAIEPGVPVNARLPRTQDIAAGERPAIEPGGGPEAGPRAGRVGQLGDPAGSVALLDGGPGWARLSVRVDRPTWLLARETYAAGWRATIDGQPAALYPAAALFLAVQVPPGDHQVILAYREAGLLPGALLTLATLVGLPLALRSATRGMR